MSPDYAECAALSNFTFLEGGSHPEELVTTAIAAGLSGLAITDRNSVAGVVRAHGAIADLRRDGVEIALRYHPGCRLAFADGTPDILVHPRNRVGWGRLCRLLTLGNRRSAKGQCTLTRADVLAYAEGLAFAVLPSDELLLMADAPQILGALLADLATAAPGHARLAARMAHNGLDRRRLGISGSIADTARVPLLAVNDVLYHAPIRRPLQDILTSIRHHTTLEAAGRLLQANAERHIKTPAEMARLFRDRPDAIAETIALSQSLTFSLDELRYEYPDEIVEGFATPQEALIHFTYAGAAKRYPAGVPDKVRFALAHELELIGGLGYAPYFLTVFDIVRFAREQGILCQGRGSAANSAVCFCLGVTEVDPEKSDLLFERFVSAERREPPDIDVDFEHERREEVIQYIYRRYGRERAGLAATVISYRARSAMREVGKVYGLSADTLDALAGSIWGWGAEGIAEIDTRAAGVQRQSPVMRQVLAASERMIGFPRHLSQHVGGFVMTRGRLDELVPIQNAAMPDRTVIEWDKDDLDTLGILKVDVLGLGMLTCLKNAFDFLKKDYGQDLAIATLPSEDPAVYKMIQRADTLGVFQIESRAQMSMLPRLKPAKFYDLVIEVAIVRPGPIQGDMVHPYLRRRQGIETVSYPSKELEAVLGKTLGVPLFQEQAMKIAIVAAGFTPSEADRLRRAMATFRKVGTIGTFAEKMVEGMVANGYERDFAERCFKQLEGFGEYGFPESHAASFALLVYASCWVKCRYPDVFCAALLNAQPLGFYAPAQIIRDAREHGIEMRPVDVNFSEWDAVLEKAGVGRDESGVGEGGFDFQQSHKLRHPREGGDPSIHPKAIHRLSEETGQSWPSLDHDSSGLAWVPACAGMTRGESVATTLHPRHVSMAGDILGDRAVRVGMREIKGLPEAAARVLEVARRAGGAFDSVRDVWLRTGLEPSVLERLADADAFVSLGLSRRDALWAVKGLGRTGDTTQDLPLFAAAVSDRRLEPDARLPTMPLGEEVVHDYRVLRHSLKAHPVAFIRPRLDARRATPHGQLETIKSGTRLTVAGLVLVRQRPGSAKGVIFMTLEDESGVANVIVWPKVFERFRPVILGARCVLVTGRLQNETGVIHVVADRLDDATDWLADLAQAGPLAIDTIAHADEVKRPQPDAREKRIDAELKRRERAASVTSATAPTRKVGPPAEPIQRRASEPVQLNPPPKPAHLQLSALDVPARATRHAMPKGRNFR